MSTVKYYFGYNSFSGLIFPVKWTEEGGKAVGGKPTEVRQPMEITAEDYFGRGLMEMVRRHPYLVVDPETKPP